MLLALTRPKTERQLVAFGALLGLVFGTWNIVASVVAPVMDDTPLALLSFYGPMFAAWGFAGSTAFRRTRRFRSAAAAGGMVALVTFVVFTVIVIARMNLSLDTIVRRPDWQNMVARYPESGFGSFRAYANYIYLTGAPFKIAVASMIGVLSGFVGGVVSGVGRTRTTATKAQRT
jgi:hypothetical protein